jgi:hypothetical protein
LPSSGDLFLERWYTRMTGNVAVGLEAVIRKTVVLRGGFFTDLSSAPMPKKRSNELFPNDVNRYGAALSAGLMAGGYDLSIGAAGRMGRGKGMAYSAADFEFTYHRTNVEEQTVFVFISGAKRAVTRLAKQAYRKLRDRDEEPETKEPAPRAEPAATEPSTPPATVAPAANDASSATDAPAIDVRTPSEEPTP